VAELETPRLRLRLMEAGSGSDRSLYSDLYNDPAVMRRIAPLLGIEAAVRGFEAACRHNLAEAPGHRFWRVDDKASEYSVGLAALRRDGSRAEIGVMLFSQWWNKGVCGEVFVPLLEHGFERAGLEAIDARSAEDEGLPVIERLLAPFGFIRTRTGAADGVGQWELPRAVWEARRAAD
jgi:RimJ/RimL family protein N-acetyltransferase